MWLWWVAGSGVWPVVGRVGVVVRCWLGCPALLLVRGPGFRSGVRLWAGVGGSGRTRRRVGWPRASRQRRGAGFVGRCGRSGRPCGAGCSGGVSARPWRGQIFVECPGCDVDANIPRWSRGRALRPQTTQQTGADRTRHRAVRFHSCRNGYTTGVVTRECTCPRPWFCAHEVGA